MKIHFNLLFIFMLASNVSLAQPAKKIKQTAPPNMDKMMQDAMKGMSNEEKAEMKKMMKGVMPELIQNNSKVAYYPEFTSNTQLIPKKDITKINALSKKKLTQADINGYATTLYNKMIAKGNAAEMAIAKKVIAQSPNANDISGAAILAMMQGHPQAAMALSMKAVQLDPANPSYQNNMASLLTQYGYPEQAVPVLQKLRNDFPDNSTVMNNLAHAWLGLGEIDSVKTIIKKAGGLNPYHPESKETEGVIEEATGNSEKALEDYEASMENAINPFTEQLIKNSKKKQSKSGSLDFEKLKRSVTIYEYFPEDWIKMPQLSDNVSGYEKDMRIKNGYSKMLEELRSKTDVLTDASQEELNALIGKTGSENAFAAEMMKESMKGMNVMSKPALVVQLVLQNYMAEWMVKYVTDCQELTNSINAAHQEMTKSGKDDKCPDYDRRNNEFLKYANPIIRKFHAKKIEEFRVWLNTFCTWAWYLTGNPKNTIMTQCIAWTAAITGFYKNAIEDQRAIPRTCIKQDSDGIEQIQSPEIPNFSCPTLVKMPIGADWQDLSNATKNFNNNKHAIKKTLIPVPNHTIAYGADHTSIPEPGRDPFVKSANGSITPGMINDDELTPLSKIPNVNDPVPLPDLGKRKLANYLLKKMMTSDCKNIRNRKDIFEEDDARIRKRLKELEFEADDARIKKRLQELEFEADDARIRKRLQELEFEADDARIRKRLKELGATPAIQQNGLQPSLSSGLQAPGTFTPQKGLFQ
jgi:tetratricopeptide (TPR) repeat protein